MEVDFYFFTERSYREFFLSFSRGKGTDGDLIREQESPEILIR